MSKTLIPKMKKRCKDCPPMVVPPRSYTPSRPSCIECSEKHLGAAYVLLTELNELPDTPAERRQGFSRRLRAIGHLFEAEDESQQWPDLHTAIRKARKAYQATATPPAWDALATVAAECRGAT